MSPALPTCARLAALALLTATLACGGGGGGTAPAPVVSIAVTPGSQSLATAATFTFSATVQNAASQAVTWSLQEGAAAGTLSASGVYTAPAMISGASATFHVVATLVADPTKSASAAVTVNAHTYQGTWSATGSLASARYIHTATLLPSGKVLAAGGFGPAPYPAVGTMELYDPATGAWTPTASLATARGNHRAVLLNNGKVLIAGGGAASGVVLNAELYDPATGTVAPAGTLTAGRSQFAMARMADGRVLAAGGSGSDNKATAAAEVFDPATGLWTAVAPLPRRMRAVSALLLPSGKVMVAGGYDETDNIVLPVYLFDPATGTWTSPGNLLTLRYAPEFHLLPGTTKVVVLGSTSYAEVFDTATGASVALPPFDAASPAITSWPASVQLDSGRVLVAGLAPGGLAAGVRCFQTDAAGTAWTATGSLGTSRLMQRAVRLQDHRILVVGGENTATLATCELYQ